MTDLVPASNSSAVSRYFNLGRKLKFTLPSMIQYLIDALLEAPLFQLYLSGPSVHSVGFWEGRPKEEICATMTGVPSSHWSVNQSLCEELIMNRFESWMVLLYVVIYGWILLKIVCQVTRLCLPKRHRRPPREFIKFQKIIDTIDDPPPSSAANRLVLQ